MEMTFAQSMRTIIALIIMFVWYYRHVTGRTYIVPMLQQQLTIFFERPAVQNVVINASLVVVSTLVVLFILSGALKFFM